MRKVIVVSSVAASAGLAVTLGVAFVSGLVGAGHAAFEFDWQIPCTFRVQETISKKGMEAKLRHTLALAETNGELQLRWLDTKYLSINGEDATTPEMKEAMKTASAMYVSLPALRISRQGRFLGASNLKESLRASSRILDSINTNRTEQNRAKWERAMTDPDSLKLYEGILSQYWSTWVENWIGFGKKSYAPPKSRTRVTGDTNSVSTEITYENAGTVKSDTNLVHLKSEEVTKGPELSRAILKMLDGFDEKFKAQGDPARESVSIERRIIKLDVITNPRNLRPAVARRSVTISMETPDEGKVESREVHIYDFIWPGMRLPSIKKKS